MAIYDFFLSRNNGATVETYVGHQGRLFYDEDEKVIRYSDGETVGGFPINPITTSVTTTEPTNVPEGAFWLNPDTYELWCYHDGEFIPTIDTATETKIGGIKLGPGVTVNGLGQLVINTEGLDFNFGDFFAFTNPGPSDGACLSSINDNQDVNLVSNGTGSVNVVGEFHIHATNETLEGSLSGIPSFGVNADGQVKIVVPDPTSLAGGVQIIGNDQALQQDPVNQGIMLHITGHDGIEARSYLDSVGAYAGFVGRRANGSSTSPSAVLANQEVSRYAANAFTSDNGYEAAGIGQLRWYATENQTSTNKGGRAEFWTVPTGSNVAAKVVTIDGSGLTMATGKTIVGNVSGTSTNAVNLTAASSIVAGQITVNPAQVVRATASVQTFTINGLTIAHKILLLPASQLSFGMVISAAWPSATNTVSVEFQNLNGNTDVDLGVITLDYLAWI